VRGLPCVPSPRMVVSRNDGATSTGAGPRPQLAVGVGFVGVAPEPQLRIAATTAAGTEAATRRLVAMTDAALARDKTTELETRYRIEQERLALMTETIDSQLAVQQSQVDRLRAIADFQQNVVRSLEVRAGESGVVSDLTLHLGQYVLAGTILAKVLGRFYTAEHPAVTAGAPGAVAGAPPELRPRTAPIASRHASIRRQQSGTQ
jgi:hypothetical protein